MEQKKIIILDGAPSEDNHLGPILKLLLNVLHARYGNEIVLFSLRDMEIKHCIGCFNCWTKTPGKCSIYKDAGDNILQEVLQRDIVILFTPVAFGSYSSELKKALDRFLPILLPFFKKIHNEIHHVARYPFFPRLVGIGVHPSPDTELIECFKLLTGRNAINFNSQSYSAGVIDSTDSAQDIIYNVDTLLLKNDNFPYKKELCSLPKMADPQMGKLSPQSNALLLVGSPKQKKSSTSSVLGNALLKKLEKRGWSTTALPLKQKLLCTNKNDLFSAIAKADLIIITCPLYGDTIPFLTTKAFELIEQKKEEFTNRDQKRVIAIVNNGFPETYQNFISLSICRNFAHECGMSWAGGLAMGAGEVLLSGQPITGFKGYKGIIRPPLYYIDKALCIAADSLSLGLGVPDQAVELMARKPLSFISFNFWCYLYIKIGKKIALKEAMKQGVQPRDVSSRPIRTPHDKLSKY